MNKFYKFIAMFIAIFAFTAYVNAQTWTAPAYKGEVPVAGTAYYVYNVGANGFLVRGGDWATHCAVASLPIANASTQSVKWKIAEPATGQFTFEYVQNDVASNTFIFHPGDWDVWGDGAASGTERNFLLAEVDATNHIMTIQKDVFVGLDKYFGWSGYSQATNKGAADQVFTDKAAGSDNTKWKFISQANYDLYNAKVLLDKYMKYAKLKGGIDLTSYISTYNSDVTADITTAAGTLLTALGRTDVSASILNPSFETNTFANWTNGGSFALQNNNPGMWTKGGTYYAEKWVSSNNNLGAGTITQTLTGLTNGLYELVMTGHAVQQGGSNPLHTGAFATAGNSSKEVSVGGQYSVDYVTVIDGTLTIGYKLEAPVACNWTGFDNFMLYYYGATAVPSMSSTESSLYYNTTTTASKTFNVSGANLTGNITLTAPTGITLTGTNLVSNGGGSYTILAANANVTNTITATWDGLASIKGLNITVAETEVSTLNVAVEASADNTCFTPLYSSRTNLITDPYCNDLANFAGWGGRSIEKSYVYCGSRSIKVTGKCGGSLDYKLTGKIEGNKAYRVRAMVSTNGTGEAKIGISGATSPNVLQAFTTAAGEWLPIDFYFYTQATVTSPNMYLNSCESQTATESYIDNWEMYDITDLVTGTIAQKDNLVNVFVRNNKIMVSLNVVNVENAEASVYSVNGMLLSTQKLNLTSGITEKQLNANLPAGAYVVKVVTDGKSYTQKVIK